MPIGSCVLSQLVLPPSELQAAYQLRASSWSLDLVLFVSGAGLPAGVCCRWVSTAIPGGAWCLLTDTDFSARRSCCPYTWSLCLESTMVAVSECYGKEIHTLQRMCSRCKILVGIQI